MTFPCQADTHAKEECLSRSIRVRKDLQASWESVTKLRQTKHRTTGHVLFTTTFVLV